MTFQLLPVLLARFSKVKWVLTHAVLAAVWCRHVNTQLPLHPLSLPLRSWAGWSCPRAPSAVWRNWDHTLLSCVHILSHCSSPWPYSNPVHDWVLILYKYFETYLKKKNVCFKLFMIEKYIIIMVVLQIVLCSFFVKYVEKH